MRGDKPVFGSKSELSELELPRGTVLEVESTQEYEVNKYTLTKIGHILSLSLSLL